MANASDSLIDVGDRRMTVEELMSRARGTLPKRELERLDVQSEGQVDALLRLFALSATPVDAELRSEIGRGGGNVLAALTRLIGYTLEPPGIAKTAPGTADADALELVRAAERLIESVASHDAADSYAARGQADVVAELVSTHLPEISPELVARMDAADGKTLSALTVLVADRIALRRRRRIGSPPAVEARRQAREAAIVAAQSAMGRRLSRR